MSADAAATRALPAGARVSTGGHPRSAERRRRLGAPGATARSFASSAHGSPGPVGWKSLAAMCATGGGLLSGIEMQRQKLQELKRGLN